MRIFSMRSLSATRPARIMYICLYPPRSGTECRERSGYAQTPKTNSDAMSQPRRHVDFGTPPRAFSQKSDHFGTTPLKTSREFQALSHGVRSNIQDFWNKKSILHARSKSPIAAFVDVEPAAKVPYIGALTEHSIPWEGEAPAEPPVRKARNSTEHPLAWARLLPNRSHERPIHL
jgi:hypothetical protein